MPNLIETHDLCVAFGSKLALNHVNFTLPEGEILGLVGKNGAGKSTLIRVLSGLILPDKGDYSLFGVSDPERIEAAHQGVVAMIETPRFYEGLTAEKNLAIRAKAAGFQGDLRAYVDEKLDYVGLGQVKGAKKKVKGFSLGMRQRLAIAMALTQEPKLMLLDEPTNGLDPEGIAQIRELLLRLNREQGVTILLSSHILPELERFATSYAFMDNGVILKQVSAKELERETEKAILLTVDDPEKGLKALIRAGVDATLEDGKLRIVGEKTVAEPLRILSSKKIAVYDVKEAGVDLEQYYLNLIGEAGKEGK